MYNTRGFVSKTRGVNVSSGTVVLNLNCNCPKDSNVAYIIDTAGTVGNEYYLLDLLSCIVIKAQVNSAFTYE